MKNYVQYHNSDKNDGRPSYDGEGFAIYANKSVRHLMGQRVWLVSGESRTNSITGSKNRTKTYFLENTFEVDRLEEGEPNIASGRLGVSFDPPIPLDGLSWFDDFKRRQQNFSLGVREIDADFLPWFEILADQYSGHDDVTPEERAAAIEIDSDAQCFSLDATERSALIQARIGQGSYRRSLLELWDGRCAVTGLSVEAVLVASHAKPWRTSSNTERIDPYNGLLLAASVDRLFDKGLIGFADDGHILVSDVLSDADLKCIGLTRSSRLLRIDGRHIPYLTAHRTEVFHK